MTALPKPSIFWHRAPDAEGKHHFRCTSPEEYAGGWFSLYQGGIQEPVAEKKASPTQSEVTFIVHSSGSSEQFRCSYQVWDAGKTLHSPHSNPVNVTEDHYPKPFIAVSPGTEVSLGQDWTIRCWAPLPGVAFVLYQGRDFRMEVIPRGDSYIAEFFLKDVTVADTGRYTCYYHSITEPFIWSNASNPVQLTVTDAAEVPIYQEVLVDSAGRYRVNCSAPSMSEGWFYLYQNGKLFAQTRAWQDGRTTSFNLTEEALSTTTGELSCLYGLNWLNDTDAWTQDSRSRSTDFSKANMLRLGLGAGILLVALLFVADAYWNERQQRGCVPSEEILAQEDPSGLIEALLCKTSCPGTCV
ncbi:immunoglobulin superfamily member 1-like [Eublepharis macularius]|uniref:immunoglobulin superfamily member 1-like n=1 Tax=Eublepharis macularius TaxID=481883 RepID=UPI00240F1716|nr:immunoglobulin superfamily member 1-like [Eublepharis macularius]